MEGTFPFPHANSQCEMDEPPKYLVNCGFYFFFLSMQKMGDCHYSRNSIFSRDEWKFIILMIIIF